MKKQLIIAGGGHAHLLTLANLHTFIAAGFTVNVIAPSKYHYYSGMGPGMLGNSYSPESIRFATKTLVEKMGATFTLDSVTKINPIKQLVHLASGSEIKYDILSCNLGSQVSNDLTKGDHNDVFPVKPIEGLLQAKQRIIELGKIKKITVGIVGGGPSAIEIAGNVWRLAQKAEMKQIDITVFTGKQLLPQQPKRMGKLALESLQKRGIQINQGCRVKSVESGSIVLNDSKVYKADIIFVATGVKPSTVFTDSNISTGPDGGMQVNQYLQNPTYPTIFGGGDCIHFNKQPLDKVGVYAVRQGPILYHNLLAAMQDGELKPFSPNDHYLQILNLGDGTGILNKWSVAWNGSGAFRVKDYIDRKFVQRYQVGR